MIFRIIIICWFAAQETFLIIINDKNSYAAQYFTGTMIYFIFRIHRWTQSSKEQHLFETEIIRNTIKVFIITTSDQFNTFMLKRCIYFFNILNYMEYLHTWNMIYKHDYMENRTSFCKTSFLIYSWRWVKDRMVIFGCTILYLIGLNVISMENVYIKIEWLITLLYRDEIISHLL